MCDANFVHVIPQRRRGGPVLVADELDQITLQEVFAVQNVLMGEAEILGSGRGGSAFLTALTRHEGFGRDVVAKEFGIDEVESHGNEGRDKGFGSLDAEAI